MSREQRVGMLFAAPWILGFLVFYTYPILASFYYSFTSYSVLRPPVWVGLDNYKDLVQDQVFVQSAWNTAFYVALSVPLSTILAIALALLLNQGVKGKGIYRTLFFVPTLVPLVAQGTLFLWVFNNDHGILVRGIKAVGLNSPNWLGDPLWTKLTLVLIALWGCGQAVVIYLAGLQDVPTSLYEAANLDGASAWKKTISITVPQIAPVIRFNVIIGIIGSMQIFATPFVMFPGGQPARSTYFLTSYLYDNAFQYQRMGYASAIGWIILVVTLTLTFIALRVPGGEQ